MSVAAAALNSYATPDPEQIGRFLLLKKLGQGALPASGGRTVVDAPAS